MASFNGVRVVARLMWIPSLLLVLLAINQARVAYELRATYEQGTEAVADVVEFETTDRVDVTMDAVTLRVTLPDGSEMVKEDMSLPRSIASRIQGAEEVDVRVRPGAAQEVVIEELMPAHWLIAAAQVGVALFGAIIVAVGAYFWNRYLKRKGDPADASPEDSPVAERPW